VGHTLFRWAELRNVADDKKSTLELAHDVNQFHSEIQETKVREDGGGRRGRSYLS